LSVIPRTLAEPPVIMWTRWQWALVWIGLFAGLFSLIWAVSFIPLGRRIAVHPRHFWTGRVNIPLERIKTAQLQPQNGIKTAQLQPQNDYSVLNLTLISGVVKEFGVPREHVERLIRVLDDLQLPR
jgi:hypothetical protein